MLPHIFSVEHVFKPAGAAAETWTPRSENGGPGHKRGSFILYRSLFANRLTVA